MHAVRRVFSDRSQANAGKVVWLKILAFMLVCNGAIASDATPRPSVLFICEHGSVKSLIAASVFEAEARRQGLEVQGISRGIVPDERVPPRIVDALRSEGIDKASFAPRRATQDELRSAVRVVTIGIDPTALDLPEGRVERWDDIPSSSDYRAARAEIQRRVEDLISRLRP